MYVWMWMWMIYTRMQNKEQKKESLKVRYIQIDEKRMRGEIMSLELRGRNFFKSSSTSNK